MRQSLVWGCSSFRFIRKFSLCAGFHEFAEFTAEDVGTVDSGLNSMVLASNDEMVLLPVNEPTLGTKRCVRVVRARLRCLYCALGAHLWHQEPTYTKRSVVSRSEGQ